MERYERKYLKEAIKATYSGEDSFMKKKAIPIIKSKTNLKIVKQDYDPDSGIIELIVQGSKEEIEKGNQEIEKIDKNYQYGGMIY